VLLRPVVRNLALPLAVPRDISSSNNSWHQAILAFAGDITASIVDGSFTDNVAGSVLVARQQAVLSVTNSSFQRNNSTYGGELHAVRETTLQTSCLLRIDPRRVLYLNLYNDVILCLGVAHTYHARDISQSSTHVQMWASRFVCAPLPTFGHLLQTHHLVLTLSPACVLAAHRCLVSGWQCTHNHCWQPT
jgi:hypothetical protein